MANAIHLFYSFNPGEFVRYNSPAGDDNIGQFLTLSQHAVTVQRWLPDPTYEIASIHLPSCFIESAEHQVIPMPNQSSLVHMVKASDVSDFRIRFVYGMGNIICTRRDDIFFTMFSSHLLILFLMVSLEFQLSYKGFSATEEKIRNVSRRLAYSYLS
jgi:hypothetical protein